eukprot:8330007-Alexandrium_andersonii.AAC.1
MPRHPVHRRPALAAPFRRLVQLRIRLPRICRPPIGVAQLLAALRADCCYRLRPLGQLPVPLRP